MSTTCIKPCDLPSLTGEYVTDRKHLFVVRLQELLYTGSQSVIYRAKNVKTTAQRGSEYYAVKCVSKAGLTFHEENAVHAGMVSQKMVSAHPNVATAHCIIDQPGYFFLIMDLIEGGNLRDAIESGVFHKHHELCKQALLQLIDGIAACHKEGIAHRDLKMEHILCSKDGGKLYITDFSRYTEDARSYEWNCGTGPYISPEVLGTEIKGYAYNSKEADTWALGILFVNITTAHTLWETAHSSDREYRHYVQTPDSLRRLFPISAAFSNILSHILIPAKDRLNLKQMRKAIKGTDNFFMTDRELMEAPQTVRKVAKSYFAEHASNITFDEDSGTQFPVHHIVYWNRAPNRTWKAIPAELMADGCSRSPSFNLSEGTSSISPEALIDDMALELGYVPHDLFENGVPEPGFKQKPGFIRKLAQRIRDY